MDDLGATAAGMHKGRLKVVLALTASYLAAEVVGGLVTGSLALLADAGHMLTDVAGLAMALLAIRFGERPATPERTYGFYRVEILAALANAVILIGISLYILVEAYDRFQNPPPIVGLSVLMVAGLGLVVNVVGMFLLKGGSSASLNIKGAYFEVLSDALTSVGVIAAALIMHFTGWYYADPLVSAGIGLFILPRTWRLLREAVGVLLEGTPADVNVVALRTSLESVSGVESIHDLHVWSLTSGRNALSVHVVLATPDGHHEVLTAVRDRVSRDFGITHLTIQTEASGCQGGEGHA